MLMYNWQCELNVIQFELKWVKVTQRCGEYNA